MESRKCDVVVIGAGLSGLSAAYYMKKRNTNLDIVVLEAKPRLGGRTLTVDMEVSGGRKAKFDLGGQWVGPLQSDLLELMNELGISDLLYSQYLTGTKVAWINPDNIMKYNSDLPFYNPLIYLEAFFLMRKFDSIADSLDENNPFQSDPALAEYLDSITVEAFLRENVHNSAFREIIRIGLRSAFGMEASQMSALYLILYGKSSGRLENVFSPTNDGCQKWRVKGGTQQISDKLADFVGLDKVFLSSPVTAIEQTEDHSAIFITALIHGKPVRFTARRAVSAIPPNQLLTIKISPPMPPSRAELMRAMPMGNIYKFIITYETAFWRKNKLSGETCCYGGNIDVTDDCPVGIACVSFDACLVDGTPALVGLMGGHQNVYWRQRSPAERRKAVLETIAKMLGNEALKPIDFREKDWGLEQWTGGCPVNVLQPGVGRFYTESLRLPIGHLYLAGTESAQRSCGFLSGAVQSGRRAATEVLYSLDQHSILDDAVLTMTCFGSAGKATRGPKKWLTTADPYVSSLKLKFPFGKILVLLGIMYLIHRRHPSFGNRFAGTFYRVLNH